MTAVTEEHLTRVWKPPHGVLGLLKTVSNVEIAKLFLVTTVAFFLLAGADSLVIRAQLAVPENDLVSPQTYNGLFTTHGTAMMFLFAVPVLEALAIYLLPLMLGARDMAFPRMSAFTFWTFLFGGLLFYGSTLPDIINFVAPGKPLPNVVPDVGWFAYPPLSSLEFSPGLNVDFYLLGLGFAEIAGIGAAIELIVTILKLRAPGMALHRMPLFAWSILVTAFAILFAFPAVLVGTTLLELERKFQLPFFDPARGGDPLLWQHLFWIFGHPEVYIILIPATGIVSMVVPTMARRPIAGYTFIAMAVVATGLLSFGLWVHHMFATGLPLLSLGLFGAASMMITIPSGVQVFAWTATFLNGGRARINSSILWVLGFIITFVLGGITGVMVASPPYDWQVHDTHFVSAHLHYVLVGGMVFPLFAGVTYWWPKMTGRMLDEGLGKLSFWLFFIGFNVTFLPQHNAGLLGMPRRVFTYQAESGLGFYNLVSTIGAFVMALGVLAFGGNAVRSFLRNPECGSNPWNAPSLEWAVSSPPPAYNIRAIPQVRSRYPLWEGELQDWEPEQSLPEPDEPGRLWRETLVTTALDARPEAVAVVAQPSYTPLALGVALTVMSVGLIFELHLLIGLAILASAVLVVFWLWPDKERRELQGAGATLGNPSLPVYASGSAATGWWGMVLTLVAMGAVFALLIFSYFYLRYSNPVWPLGDLNPPAVILPLISTVILLVSMAPMYLAERAIERDNQVQLRLGLALGFVLGFTFLALQLFDYAQMDLAPHTNAYGAIFLATAGFHIALTVVGLAMNAVVQVQALLGYFNARRMLAVENTTLYWAFVVGTWVVTAATLYGTPYLS